MTDIKDCKTILEEGINDLLNSEKEITDIKERAVERKRPTVDQVELLVAILDSELLKLKGLREAMQKLYRPYKDK